MSIAESKSLSLVRDFSAMNIAYISAAECFREADIEQDWIAQAFSEAAYQGVLYDIGASMGMVFAGICAVSVAVQSYKISYARN